MKNEKNSPTEMVWRTTRNSSMSRITLRIRFTNVPCTNDKDRR